MGMFKKNRLRKWLLLALALLVSSCAFIPDYAKEKSDSRQSELAVWMSDNGHVKVCTTTPLIASSVRIIGGDKVDVISIMGPEIDPHLYEIVKGDADKLSRADIVIANGLSLEHGVSMRRVLSSHPNVVYLGNYIPKEEIIYVNGSADPHIWMDLLLWSKTNAPIEEALIEKDPENTKFYQENSDVLVRNYIVNDKKIKEQMQSIDPKERRLVSSHDAFNYYARRYLDHNGDWKDRVIAIQGLSTEEQISAIEIRNVVEYVKKYNVKVIFAEKNLSRDSLLKVIDSCKRSGQEVILSKDELYGDTLGQYTYIEMINHNADILDKNLKGSAMPPKRDGCGCY